MGKRRIKFDLLIHDLKGPLAVIETGLLTLLQREDKYGPLTDKQHKVLKRALRNTLVTKTLVNDALEVSRSTDGIINKHRFVLSSLINQALVEFFDLIDSDATESIKECGNLSILKQMLLGKGIVLNIEDNLWHQEIIMDAPKIGQILRNLLGNALKYKKSEVEIHIEKDGNSLLVAVRDDGQGIPVSYQKSIFECYFQMDQQKDYCIRGHGLGLAGVMVLVEDMGGQLTLRSDAGKGATFLVKIPMET